MIVTYLRSSSYNTYDFCERKYFIDYTLGWRSPANKKASKGTIVHKALEMLAQIKLAQQNLQNFIVNDELGKFYISELTPDICVDLAYHHISSKETFYDWSEEDFKDCRKWTWDALKYRDGMFNPLKQNIVKPEQYFDIEIRQPWAYYNYKMPNGEKLEGYFSIKGTLDLLVKLDTQTYELIDYKTGKRMDWNTGEEKTYKKLRNDPQLRMYHYATSILFPEIEHIIVSIFYIQDGGVFSMDFNKDDIAKTEEMLKKRFNVIRNNYRPKKIYPSWKCTKLCHFGKHDLEGNKISSAEYKEKSICSQIGNDLLQLGVDRVMLKHSKSDVSNYGSGGGRSNKDE
jgi:RecB family exonuclease